MKEILYDALMGKASNILSYCMNHGNTSRHGITFLIASLHPGGPINGQHGAQNPGRAES